MCRLVGPVTSGLSMLFHACLPSHRISLRALCLLLALNGPAGRRAKFCSSGEADSMPTAPHVWLAPDADIIGHCQTGPRLIVAAEQGRSVRAQSARANGLRGTSASKSEPLARFG